MKYRQRYADDGAEMARSLGTMIADRLTAMGRSRADLRTELRRSGVTVTRQSVHNWITDATRPGAGHMLALLDVLMIPEVGRREWFEAQARPVGEDLPTEHA